MDNLVRARGRRSRPLALYTEVLRNGQPALLIEGPTATSITWFRGRVRFDVIGPAGEFPPEAAWGVANS